jgi:hypothetical protein
MRGGRRSVLACVLLVALVGCSDETSSRPGRQSAPGQRGTTAFCSKSGQETGTLVADPLFVDFRTDGTGDYRLQRSSPAVDAGAVKVETLNGAVSLSGFAKSNAEKAQAEYLARNTKGVRQVLNHLTVRP